MIMMMMTMTMTGHDDGDDNDEDEDENHGFDDNDDDGDYDHDDVDGMRISRNGILCSRQLFGQVLVAGTAGRQDEWWTWSPLTSESTP